MDHLRSIGQLEEPAGLLAPSRTIVYPICLGANVYPRKEFLKIVWMLGVGRDVKETYGSTAYERPGSPQQRRLGIYVVSG